MPVKLKCKCGVRLDLFDISTVTGVALPAHLPADKRVWDAAMQQPIPEIPSQQVSRHGTAGAWSDDGTFNYRCGKCRQHWCVRYQRMAVAVRRATSTGRTTIAFGVDL